MELLKPAWQSENEEKFEKSKKSCIVCGRCTKACKSLGVSAISLVNREVLKKIPTPDDASKDCIGCASCAEVCPVNCIEVLETKTSRKIWNSEFEMAICEVCGASLQATTVQHEVACKRAEVAHKLICGDCKKQNIARSLAEIYGE